jgi:hypothetical protein
MVDQRATRNVALRALRLERHWTQVEFCAAFEARSREFGRPLSLSVRQVRRWESANPPCPLPAYQRVLEALFGVPVTEMGFRPPWTVAWPSESAFAGPVNAASADNVGEAWGHGWQRSYERYGPVRRRDFMAGAVALGSLPMASAPPNVESARESAGRLREWQAYGGPGLHGPLDATTVDGYVGITAHQRKLYWAVPAPRMYETVTAHAQFGVGLLRGSGTAELRGRLASSVAEATMLAARIAFFDLRQPNDARHYYQAAFAASREADDHALGSAVLAHLAFIPAYSSQAGEARDLVRAAHAHASRGVSAVHKAWLYAVEAEIEAKLGGSARSIDLIGQCEDAFGRDARYETPQWLDYFDASRISGFRGYCELAVGRASQAATSLGQTLTTLAPSAGKQRAIVLADLADSYARQAEVERSCQLLTDALHSLRDQWYATAMERVQGVRGTLLRYGDTQPVRDLDDTLHSWRHTLAIAG